MIKKTLKKYILGNLRGFKQLLEETEIVVHIFIVLGKICDQLRVIQTPTVAGRAHTKKNHNWKITENVKINRHGNFWRARRSFTPEGHSKDSKRIQKEDNT